MRVRVALGIAALLVLVAFTGSAQAGIGIAGFSRSAAAPGDAVRLTLGCGLCYPPCNGPAAAGPGKACIPGKQLPPTSFPVSMVPVGKAPKLRPCGPNRLCPPVTKGPPSRPPFTYLGEATGPVSGQRGVPSYPLDFEVPRLPPGTYAYVVFADFFQPGKRGTLLSFPSMRAWRLRVTAAEPTASIRR